MSEQNFWRTLILGWSIFYDVSTCDMKYLRLKFIVKSFSKALNFLQALSFLSHWLYQQAGKMAALSSFNCALKLHNKIPNNNFSNLKLQFGIIFVICIRKWLFSSQATLKFTNQWKFKVNFQMFTWKNKYYS